MAHDLEPSVDGRDGLSEERPAELGCEILVPRHVARPGILHGRGEGWRTGLIKLGRWWWPLAGMGALRCIDRRLEVLWPRVASAFWASERHVVGESVGAVRPHRGWRKGGRCLALERHWLTTLRPVLGRPPVVDLGRRGPDVRESEPVILEVAASMRERWAEEDDRGGLVG